MQEPCQVLPEERPLHRQSDPVPCDRRLDHWAAVVSRHACQTALEICSTHPGTSLHPTNVVHIAWYNNTEDLGTSVPASVWPAQCAEAWHVPILRYLKKILLTAAETASSEWTDLQLMHTQCAKIFKLCRLAGSVLQKFSHKQLLAEWAKLNMH